MEERGNKTIMCSVLFLDIVEYSKQTVAGQIALKERFNTYLADAIRDVPLADRIILDTGDGAAINFLGDVEDALKAALSLREHLLTEDPNTPYPLRVRMGINLGPVRLVRDINGQPNIVGDGINVAQRVMGFSEASQILVSRSYYDAVASLSPHYAELFRYEGSRTDKHVREHEVYAIGRADGQVETTAAPEVVRRPVKRRALFAAVGVGALVFGAILLLSQGGDGTDSTPAEPVETAASDVAAPQQGGAASPAVTHSKSTVHTQDVEKKAPHRPAEPTKPPTIKADHPKPADSKPTQAKPSESTPAAGFFGGGEKQPNGYLQVSCRDGAQVFVDGVQKGKVGGEVLSVGIAPGSHTVIVSNASGGIYTQTVRIDSGKTVRLAPGFCSK